MNNDIFGAKSQRFGGAFSADDAIVQFASSAVDLGATQEDVGLAIENTQFQYQQRVAKAYDVTAPVVYVIRGRSEGSGAIQQLAGVRTLAQAFLEVYGDVCAMDENNLTFTFQTGCGSVRNVSESFTVASMLLTGISQSITAEDMMVRRNIPFTFLSLLRGETAAA